MEDRNLQDQHVLVLGLGLSGLAMARWCARCGAHVTVTDTRNEPPQLAALQAEVPSARFINAGPDASLLAGGDIRAVFRSPGLRPADIAIISEVANASGMWFAGELGLFCQALSGLKAERQYQPAVLAVTGTNGKTTVTALTGQLVSRAGKSVAVAGNIGPTLLDTLIACLDANALPEVWVIELSSFQLEGEKMLEPAAATVLNISQDHLDWHNSMADYVRAKANIFGQQGLMVLNREDPAVMAMLPEPLRAKLQRQVPRRYVTFGADMRLRPGDFGIEQVNGMEWLVRALEADETLKNRKGLEPELHIQRLMPVDALRIRGRHNAVNALTALALASAAGCSLGPMLYGLREYRGEPHRVQSIGVINGVEFFDDSKGTNVGATVAALSGLGRERKLVAIFGGDGKGQDFSPLAMPVVRHARAVVLIGRDAPLIRTALATTGVTLVDVASMADAVAQAHAMAKAGDAVLLSPACASFDMFDNYRHRASEFVAAVRSTARAAGVEMEGVL